MGEIPEKKLHETFCTLVYLAARTATLFMLSRESSWEGHSDQDVVRVNYKSLDYII